MISDRTLKTGAVALMVMLVAACSGGGGGTAAPDVQPGPPPANGNVTPPSPLPPPVQPNRYVEAATATAAITGVTIDSPPVVNFSVVDGAGVGLTGLTSGNVRFHIAKLVPGANGDSAHWQSYINRLKTPAVHPENAPAIQATSESGGALVDHGDGTYTYTFVTDVTNVTAPLAVAFEPTLTHRVAIQFSGGPVTNPSYDWMPETGATSGLLTKDVVTTESCNTCHNPLALHGGGRQEIELCVTCHNPGTSEPNSQESMDLAVLVHRIHMGRDLPSVQAGGEFVVYGFRDSRHDYSELGYPQEVNNCTKCHAGTATGSGALIVTPTLTGDGDNWSEIPTMSACGSCHDNVDFSQHAGGQTDNSGCQSCHNPMGIAGSVIEDHQNGRVLGTRAVAVNVSSVTNTGPGEFPQVTFSVTNPLAGNVPYDIKTDPVWTGGRLRAAFAWNTLDFTNVGAGGATYTRTDAPSLASDNGDGTFTLTSETAIPNTPGQSATGSGMLIFEGRAQTAEFGRAPVVMDPVYFSIDEANGTAVARRQVVSNEKCNSCHGVLGFHGDNRSNLEAGCQGCHNPRFATDDNQPLDFKVMIHGIHAASVRETPFQLGSDVFDESAVHYPGRVSDCRSCHVNNSWQLPLPATVLATTTDAGDDEAVYSDDVMTSAASAVCSSCHDSALARTHMTQNGGDFMASENSANTETCAVCHGPGRLSDISVAHSLE
ncbi:MAG: OmcA/MtrC family decaheme c-type cytochrome [Pseudomonadota bacterium]